MAVWEKSCFSGRGENRRTRRKTSRRRKENQQTQDHARIILHLISYPQFTYDLFHMHHSFTYLSREHMNPQLTCSQRQWLHSSGWGAYEVKNCVLSDVHQVRHKMTPIVLLPWQQFCFPVYFMQDSLSKILS